MGSRPPKLRLVTRCLHADIADMEERKRGPNDDLLRGKGTVG